MLSKKLFIFIFSSLFFLSNNLSAYENLAKDVLIKTKPKTKKKKRIRLTDAELDKIWKGEKGKNILKIDLGEVKKINQVRFRVKKDVKFKKIVLKAGETNDNKQTIYEAQDISGLANTWVALTGFNVKAQYLKLKLKKKRPKFFELEVCYEINDLNNDGYADLLIGAPNHGADGVFFGRAYVALGDENLSPDGKMDMTLTVDQAAMFGWGVAKLGDINNDGYGDFIVSAPWHNGIGTKQGQAYIYLGGPALDMEKDVILTGDQDNDFFGGYYTAGGCAGVGDVNGDGVDDLIVGAATHDGNGSRSGQTFLYFGGENLDNDVDLIFSGDETDCKFGTKVAGTGDINGDGIDDFIVGAPSHNAGGGLDANRGRVYVYFGGSDLNDSPNYPGSNLTLQDPDMQDKANFGWGLAGVGDINGDGSNDFMVGSPINNAGGSKRGKAYVYYGGSGIDNEPDFVITVNPASDGARFGISIAGLGDINGDGMNDFIIGAPLHNGGGNYRGVAYVYYGGVNLDSTPDIVLTETEDQAFFGTSVSGVGDINGDGFNDILVGASTHDANGPFYSNRGRAYLYHGGSNPDDIPDVIFNGDYNNSSLGSSTG